MTKDDIVHLIENDSWMMDILQAVKKLNLPDWWVGAGFVRSKVWDTLHEYTKRTPIPDIDVIYLEKTDFSEEEARMDTTKKEVEYERKLKKLMPEINWSVTNQARMHLFHNDMPYESAEQALSQWVETATCIGVRLNNYGKVVLSSPRGINDLVGLILRPIPELSKDLSVFQERITQKKWLEKWPKLKVVISE